MPVLQINNLSKTFGGIQAVSGVNLKINEGEIVGLIGPNGAGKTTLFNLLTGIYVPTTGEIQYTLRGKSVSGKLKPYKMSSYGISRTFQNIRLFKDMTVKDNVKIGYHANFKYSVISSLLHLPAFAKAEKNVDNEIDELLEIFHLSDKRYELAKNLPYGDQRRVEIARALASKPGLLLLDEPAAGMNPNETKELTELISWIREKFNLTIILIEHDMSLVMGISDKVVVFDYGMLIAEGTPEEVQKNPAVIRAYLGGEA